MIRPPPAQAASGSSRARPDCPGRGLIRPPAGQSTISYSQTLLECVRFTLRFREYTEWREKECLQRHGRKNLENACVLRRCFVLSCAGGPCADAGQAAGESVGATGAGDRLTDRQASGVCAPLFRSSSAALLLSTAGAVGAQRGEGEFTTNTRARVFASVSSPVLPPPPLNAERPCAPLV